MLVQFLILSTAKKFEVAGFVNSKDRVKPVQEVCFFKFHKRLSFGGLNLHI